MFGAVLSQIAKTSNVCRKDIISDDEEEESEEEEDGEEFAEETEEEDETEEDETEEELESVDQILIFDVSIYTKTLKILRTVKRQEATNILRRLLQSPISDACSFTEVLGKGGEAHKLLFINHSAFHDFVVPLFQCIYGWLGDGKKVPQDLMPLVYSLMQHNTL